MSIEVKLKKNARGAEVLDAVARAGEKFPGARVHRVRHTYFIPGSVKEKEENGTCEVVLPLKRGRFTTESLKLTAGLKAQNHVSEVRFGAELLRRGNWLSWLCYLVLTGVLIASTALSAGSMTLNEFSVGAVIFAVSLSVAIIGISFLMIGGLGTGILSDNHMWDEEISTSHKLFPRVRPLVKEFVEGLYNELEHSFPR